MEGGYKSARFLAEMQPVKMSLFLCIIQKETFEGLSQEALSLCIQSLKTASALIAQRKVIIVSA